MPGNSFGQIFRVTTFGESHGKMIGVVIDGCPSGVKLDSSFIQNEMCRRRPGQSSLTTSRCEEDRVEFVSGVVDGTTTGAPLTALIANEDTRPQDYDHLKYAYRPSHADFTYTEKYGIRDSRGGGRSSARETAARVAAGAVAKLILRNSGIQITAYVSQVGSVRLDQGPADLDLSQIEKNPVRCPDPEIAAQMKDCIEQAKQEGDTVGGVVSGLIRGCPVGLGEPVFDRLHADLGKAMLSIHAVKGFEYGSGFAGVELRGSQHNDPYIKHDGKIVTLSNHSGGIQGGISNGMEIHFRVAFKPVSTLMRDQKTVNREGESIQITGRGRHDPCVVPRAVPVVEAMAALTLADHLLRHRSTQLSVGSVRTQEGGRL